MNIFRNYMVSVYFIIVIIVILFCYFFFFFYIFSCGAGDCMQLPYWFKDLVKYVNEAGRVKF